MTELIVYALLIYVFYNFIICIYETPYKSGKERISDMVHESFDSSSKSKEELINEELAILLKEEKNKYNKVKNVFKEPAVKGPKK